MTHWKKLTNPNYLGSYAFEPGEEKILTIQSIREETVIGEEGRKDVCMVAHFTQGKPLILNHTNAKAIEKVLETPFIEEWAGKSIVLVVRKVKAFGENVDAVRVKLEKVTGVCAICGKRVCAAGEMTAKQVADFTLKKFGRVLCADCAKKQHENNNSDQPEGRSGKEYNRQRDRSGTESA